MKTPFNIGDRVTVYGTCQVGGEVIQVEKVGTGYLVQRTEMLHSFGGIQPNSITKKYYFATGAELLAWIEENLK